MKVPILVGERLTIEQCPKTYEGIKYMACVSYASLVGILMYVMFCSQPKISHAVGVLSTYMSTHGKGHWKTIKRVFRYLCGTKKYAICYQGRPEGDSCELNVHGFVDAN
jgi:hypothetical protein